MNRAGQMKQMLHLLQCRQGARQGTRGQHGGRLHRGGALGQLVKAFRAAKPATGAPGKRPAMLLENMGTLRGQLHVHFDAVVPLDDIEIVNFTGAADNTFAQAETQRKVFEVQGSGEHHRMRDAVIDQRHRHFFRHRLVRMTGNAARPAIGAVSVVCLDAHTCFALHCPPRQKVQGSNLTLRPLRYTLPRLCAIILYHIRIDLY